MPTAAPETAREVEVFRHEAKLVRQVVQMNVEGFSHEESLLQPSPAGNCLNWVMGHLLTIYERMLPYMGQKQVLEPDALKRYVRGSSSLDTTEALDFQALLAAWNEANDRMDIGLAGLTPEILDGPAPFSPSNNPNETVRSLITTALFHQAYHAGQTGLLRRIAGKEGAIR